MNGKKDIFLIDSSSLETPYESYYAFDLVPAYWNAILPFIKNGRIVVLDMVFDEVVQRVDDEDKDDLTKWIERIEDLKTIKHRNPAIISVYQNIMQYVASCGLYIESAFHMWAKNSVADPWLIATAAVNDYVLVTEEKGSGGLGEKNKNKEAKIPDVAKHFDVRTTNVYGMMRELNIKIV